MKKQIISLALIMGAASTSALAVEDLFSESPEAIWRTETDKVNKHSDLERIKETSVQRAEIAIAHRQMLDTGVTVNEDGSVTSVNEPANRQGKNNNAIGGDPYLDGENIETLRRELESEKEKNKQAKKMMEADIPMIVRVQDGLMFYVESGVEHSAKAGDKAGKYKVFSVDNDEVILIKNGRKHIVKI